MSQQIRFFEKNKIDTDNLDVGITVTDNVASDNGQNYVHYLRNRNNISAWLTTGSNDSAETELLVNMGDFRFFDSIIIVGHNLNAFSGKFYNVDVLGFDDFSVPINETDNQDSTSLFTFDEVSSNQFKLTIHGTQTPDIDKRIKQLIITSRLGSGQFEGWPKIKPRLSLNRKASKMLSGKNHINKSSGSYSATLSVKSWNSANDLSIVDVLYFGQKSFLVWPSGGDEKQFLVTRRGFRKEDIFLMECADEYEPIPAKGLYKGGFDTKIKLVEVV